MEKNPNWVPVDNVDFSKRKVKEWATIYKVKLLEEPDDDRLWSEYEWAYNFFDLKYQADLDNVEKLEEFFEEFSEREMRAMELRRDLFMGASIGEKEILKEKYIETEWVRNIFNVF
ncbi:gp432 [Bacillus phage G]|uniref:Gp432 n=1 Tax=Bacillus phage G TaxID=2884420 RepID=G3MAH3_9CAUD|nr:gp432 [Bacillus phage G]AEO93690.1 gp432 [Bacillus phage G]